MKIIFKNPRFLVCCKLAYVLIMAIGLAHLLQWTVASGRLYDYLAPWLRQQPNHSLQSALFGSRNMTSVDILVVGEPDFIHQVQQNIPSDLSMLAIPMHEFRFNDLQVTIRQTKNINRIATIVQNKPYFWTDMRPKGLKQDLRQWKKYKEKPSFNNLLPYSKVAFRLIEDAFSDPNFPGRGRGHHHQTFFNISYRFPGMKRESAYRKMTRDLAIIGIHDVFWYMNIEDIPGDASGYLRRQLIRTFTSGNVHQKLGNLLKIEDLAKLNKVLK